MYTRSTPEEIIIGCETEEVAQKLLCNYYKNIKIIYKIK